MGHYEVVHKLAMFLLNSHIISIRYLIDIRIQFLICLHILLLIIIIIETCRPIAIQRLGKHIPAEA
jgi:hypothetical protein